MSRPLILDRGHSARSLSLAALLLLTGAPLALAQEYSLFDKFSVAIGGAENSLDTTVRLDSKALGIGTSLSFEDDIDLASDEFTPDVSFQWQLKRRHNLTFYWSDVDRASTAQAAKEIQFGDLVIPLDGHVVVGFDITTYLGGYTYYPLVRDRLAVGVGGGLRVLDLRAAVALRVLPGQQPPLVVAETAEVTGPLPFIAGEVRYAVSPRWRFNSSLGLFDVTIGDISGFQGILTAEIENLVGKHFGWGVSANVSTVSVESEDDDFLGKVELDTSFVRIFVKGRL